MNFKILLALVLISVILISGCVQQTVQTHNKETTNIPGFRVKFEQIDKDYNKTRVHELFVGGEKIRLDYDEVDIIRRFYFDRSEFTACMKNVEKYEGMWTCFRMPEDEGKNIKERLLITTDRNSNFTSIKTLLGIEAKCFEYKTPVSVPIMVKCYHPEKYFLIYDEKIYGSGYKEVWAPIEIDVNVPNESVFILPS